MSVISTIRRKSTQYLDLFHLGSEVPIGAAGTQLDYKSRVIVILKTFCSPVAVGGAALPVHGVVTWRLDHSRYVTARVFEQEPCVFELAW